MKKRKTFIIAGIVIVVAGIAIAAGRGFSGGGGSDETAYVATVSELTGQNASVGMVNRFAGVVESQETWKVSKDEETDVEELFVNVGDEVQKGDSLFAYNTEKFESDLAQAKIDLERLNNEYQSIGETIKQLQKDQKKASSDQKGSYTIQIQDQELQQKDKELDIRLKNADIDKLQNKIDNATVTSGIDGVVKSINDGTQSDIGSDSDNAYITIVKVGDYRVKGTVNEQNVGQIYTGAQVIVHSRVNDQVWKGTIESIDTENGQSTNNNMYGNSGSDSSSTSFPFYVTLADSSNLMLGQHVYVELDFGQEDGNSSKEGIWIGSYMIDETDPDHPFIWLDKGGKLRKQSVTLGERNDDLGTVQVLQGLSADDSLAIPDDTLREGMKTKPMSEMMEDADYTEESVDDSGVTENVEIMEDSEVTGDSEATDDSEVTEDVEVTE